MKAFSIDELSARVQFIRDLYRSMRIDLKPDQGLALALDRAEAFANALRRNEVGRV
jgi:hypothetical protein